MAFCKSCGQDIGTAAFCPKCGASQASTGAPAPAGSGAPTVAAASPTEGLQENIAGLLCYLPAVGWLIAIILFLIDKRSFVKFHAVQALALYICLIVVYFALGIGMAVLHVMHIFFFGLFLYPVLWLGTFVLLIFLMYKAYQHERFQLPVIGGIAEGMAK